MSTWASTTPLHPSYHRWRPGGEATASAKCARTARNGRDKVQLCAIENLANVVLESAMRDRSGFEDIAAVFHDAGYRTEIALLAGPTASAD